MKMTAAKTLTAAALVALGAFALPATRAQDLGGILGKAQDAVDKAKDTVNKAKDGGNKGADAGNTPRKDGQPSDDRAAPTRSGGEFMAAEKQITTSLRRFAPKSAVLIIVSCKAGTDPSKPYAYTSACLEKAAGRMQAVSLPPLPAAIQAQFAALRSDPQPFHQNQHWEVCRVTIPVGQKETFGDENDGQFAYGYKELRGEKENDAAYKMVTPGQLLAKFQTVYGKRVREAKEQAAFDAKEERRAQQAEAAAARRAGHGPVTWVCTQCHRTYDWPEKPDGYTLGWCDEVPGDEAARHHWVRQ